MTHNCCATGRCGIGQKLADQAQFYPQFAIMGFLEDILLGSIAKGVNVSIYFKMQRASDHAESTFAQNYAHSYAIKHLLLCRTQPYLCSTYP